MWNQKDFCKCLFPKFRMNKIEFIFAHTLKCWPQDYKSQWPANLSHTRFRLRFLSYLSQENRIDWQANRSVFFYSQQSTHKHTLVGNSILNFKSHFIPTTRLRTYDRERKRGSKGQPKNKKRTAITQ